MITLSLEQVPMELPTLIAKLAPGGEIVVTDGEKPIARVTPVAPDESPPKRRRGGAKGILTIVSEDDDHLQDFAEYM